MNKTIKNTFLRLLAATSLIVTSFANAGLIYEISGDVVPTSGGTPYANFSFTVDVDDLTQILDSSHPDLLDPLYNGPWYGYDILSATFKANGLTWSENDVVKNVNEPATGGPTAEVWFQGGAIDGSFDAFALNFGGANGEVLLGFHTTGGDPRDPGPFGNIIIDETIICEPNFGNCNLGRYTNVSVSQVGATPVNAPSALVLFALGLVIVSLTRVYR